MSNKNRNCCEKFKTMIGGQALIEGIMMRGPQKDAVVVRKNGELHVETTARKQHPKKNLSAIGLLFEA